VSVSCWAGSSLVVDRPHYATAALQPTIALVTPVQLLVAGSGSDLAPIAALFVAGAEA